jgi:phosphoglycerol transferase MdoB-like AlkP superfamily enzyme
MSADHYPYALAETALNELAGHKVETNFEIYQSPFILYTPGMTPETIGKPCSSLDIIPTLSNLLGLEYDSRLLSGRDIFSDADPLVIFLNKSFITGRGRFDATLGKFMAADGSETVDPAYIRDILNEINDKFYYAAKILDKDYYRILNLNDLRNKKTS